MREDLPQWRDELLYDEYGKKRAGFAAGKARAILIASVLGVAGFALVLLAVFAGGGSGGDSTTPADSGNPGSDGSSNAGTLPGATAEPSRTTRSEPTPTPARDSTEGAVARPAEVDIDLDPERFVLPLKLWTSIGDHFGSPRAGAQVHGGLDFIVTKQPHADVLAACGGTVTAIDRSKDLGRFVVVDCGAGWTTVYGFLGEPKVKVRDVVDRGTTVLATTDPADSPFGEHLHFEIRWRGVPVDPEKLIDLTGKRYIPTPTPTAEPTATPSPTPKPGTSPAPGGTTGPGSNPTTDPGTPGGGSTPPPPPPPTATPTTPPPPTPTPTNTPTPEPTPTRTPPPPPPTATPRPRL